MEIDRRVHYDGKEYKLIYKIGKKKKLEIKGDQMIITGLRFHTLHFKSILNEFYRKEVEKELMKLIYDAEYDFQEIPFPKIKVRHLRNRLYGYYHIKNNEITLSSYLARVSLKYVKVVLYHELSHTLVITHKEEFIDVFKNKLKDGPILDEELKNICYNDYI